MTAWTLRTDRGVADGNGIADDEHIFQRSTERIWWPSLANLVTNYSLGALRVIFRHTGADDAVSATFIHTLGAVWTTRVTSVTLDCIW